MKNKTGWQGWIRSDTIQTKEEEKKRLIKQQTKVSWFFKIIPSSSESLILS